jgi:hypothetical protein
MLCEDAHDCIFHGAVTFKKIGRDLLDGISKANELRFTFGATRAAFARPKPPRLGYKPLA